MFSADEAALVVIDVQDRLWPVISDQKRLLPKFELLIQVANRLDMPVLVTEQIPDKLGSTLAELQQHLSSSQPIPKSTFSCCGSGAFTDALDATGRKKVILCGIETHVCVCQTALDLVAKGYSVFVAEDAVSSRDPHNKELALARLRQNGVQIGPCEMLVFELIRDARHPAFRELLKWIK